MKKIIYAFILITPLLFFSSCEKEEEETCTGNTTADLIVGSWGVNTRFDYYPNGDFLSCRNFCN